MIGPRWMIGRPTESTPRPAERPADAPVQGVARSHGKPAASGRISAPSDGREWMSHSGYNIAEQIEILSLRRPAICHLGPGASALFAAHYKPATWGRVGAGPPRRGAALQRLARLVPRSGGGHNPHPLAPRGCAARGICGRRPVGAERRPFSRAGRPPSAGARLVRWPPAPLCCPVSCLLPSRACLPPRAAGPPPLALGGAPPLGWGR